MTTRLVWATLALRVPSSRYFNSWRARTTRWIWFVPS
jgi:hypothetical protein